MEEQAFLRANAAAIDDDFIHAFLMIPATGPSDGTGTGVDDPYRKYWDLLKKTVHEILPRLDPQDQTRWIEYRYKTRE